VFPVFPVFPVAPGGPAGPGEQAPKVNIISEATNNFEYFTTVPCHVSDEYRSGSAGNPKDLLL